jgi:hypothetical protein
MMQRLIMAFLLLRLAGWAQVTPDWIKFQGEYRAKRIASQQRRVMGASGACAGVEAEAAERRASLRIASVRGWSEAWNSGVASTCAP